MRGSNTPRRHKSKNNGSKRNHKVPNNGFDGNGKENKIKGNPIQVQEKYQSLARDALSSGDIISAEYYFQHAEHFHRVHKTSLNGKNIQKQKDIIEIQNKEQPNESSKI